MVEDGGLRKVMAGLNACGARGQKEGDWTCTWWREPPRGLEARDCWKKLVVNPTVPMWDVCGPSQAVELVSGGGARE